MDILRPLIALVGAIVCFVGLVSAWAGWVSNEDTSGPWMLALIGAAMWLQAVPMMQAAKRKRIRELMKEREKG
jgi:hypothetical protein